MLLQIAWRNLWRNRRRTALTLVAVSLGLAAMLAMTAMMRAYGDRMIEALIGSSTGHVQIHREGYRRDQQFTLTIPDAPAVLEAVRANPGVEAAAGRIYGFAHAAFVRGDGAAVRGGGGQDVASPVVGLVGMEPEAEARVTDLSQKVVEGTWLRAPTDAVIGAVLAERNGIRLGDAVLPTTVAATGAMQGPWAVSDQVPRVVGIIRTGVEDLDGQLVVMPTSYLARLVGLEGQVHEIAIRARDADQLDPLVASLRRDVAAARATHRRGDALPATTALAIGRATADGAGPGGDAPTVRLLGVAIDDVDERGDGASRSSGLAAGRFLARAEDVVLPVALARRLGVGPGDRVAVAVPVDCGEPGLDCPPSAEPFLVAGTYEGGDLALVAEPVVRDNVAALAPAAVGRLEGEAAARAAGLVARLRGELRAGDEILPWQTLNPTLADMVQMMETAPLIYLIIIYFAVVLIIVNTMLMATYERLREFGIMRAVGMMPWRVVVMVVTESFLLSLVGVAFGLAVAVPLILYWSAAGMDLSVFSPGSYEFGGVVFDPVLWPTLDVGDLVSSSIAVMVLTTWAGVYPAFRAATVRPVDALRNRMRPITVAVTDWVRGRRRGGRR
jgi:ABC-type lipoprotein release transport system permease subunit